MSLPISPEVLRRELSEIQAALASIVERVEIGVPGDDIPSREIDEEIFQVRLGKELQLLASRFIALAEVLE